jgi:succinate dehydrogenase / fumarate reductase, cytochrome b subunit
MSPRPPVPPSHRLPAPRSPLPAPNMQFTSSIGRKVIMAVTGLFLMAFLAVHLALNATILLDDGGRLFDRTADLFRQNWGLHLLEILVLAGFLVHIAQGIALALDNRSKRSTPYAVNVGVSIEPARAMGWLGAVILAFLVLHLYQFWLPNILGTRSEHLSQLIRSTMSQWWVVVIYVLGCLAVAAHLWHGWRSAAITLGLSDRSRQLLTAIGMSAAIGLPLGLATMAIIIFLKP